jgi:hypothetical protein
LADSLNGYGGEIFEIPWGDGLDLFRVYSKWYNDKKKIRIKKEIQEKPHKPLGGAFMDKMKMIIWTNPHAGSMLCLRRWLPG